MKKCELLYNSFETSKREHLQQLLKYIFRGCLVESAVSLLSIFGFKDNGRNSERQVYDTPGIEGIYRAMNGEYAMRVIVDIEVAFDCVPFQKLCDAGREHSIDEILVKWIYAMLAQRLLCVEVGDNR